MLLNFEIYFGPSCLEYIVIEIVPVFTYIMTDIELSVHKTILIFLKLLAILPGSSKEPISFSRMKFKGVDRSTLVHSNHIFSTIFWLPVDSVSSLKNHKVIVDWTDHNTLNITDLHKRFTFSSLDSNSKYPSWKNVLAILVHLNPLSFDL